MDGPASANSQSSTVSGAGLTWSLVRRTNARFGTSEVWAAFAPTTLTNVTVTATPLVGGFRQAFTVIAFANSAGPGASASNSAATGAPTVSLTTTQANSLVYAAGNDWDRAVTHTVPANQTMVNQVLDPVGDTFWTQRLTNAVASPGAVTINNPAPTNDQWNYAAVEILSGTTVTLAPTSTGLARSAGPNPSIPGESVSFTATVTSGSGTPSGTVQFKDGVTNLGAPVTLTAGQATFTTTTLSTGAHSITAVYSGDSSFATSTSGAVAHQVTQATTATALVRSAGPNPSTVGQLVSFTATVTSGSGTPSGTVQFRDGVTNLGAPVTLTAGQATFTTTALGAGAHSITAVYSGDVTFATSTSAAVAHQVDAPTLTPTSTSVVRSAGPNPSVTGQSVSFTATVTSGSGTPSGTVQFKDGVTNLGAPVTLAAGQATLATTTLSVGAHSITAVYSGDVTFATSTSAAVAHQVDAPALTPTSTSVVRSAGPNPSVTGQSVSFTATVTTGSGTPTGTVQFKDGVTNLGAPVTLTAGQATFTTTGLGVGAHSITAVYSGDATFATSTSAALAHQVNQAATTTGVVRSAGPNPSTVGQSVSFTATVAVTAPGAGVATGSVQFRDGVTNLGAPVALTAGQAVFTTTTLGAGAHSITGVYSGDTSFTTSTSAAVAHQVNAAGAAAPTVDVTVNRAGSGAQTTAAFSTTGAGRWVFAFVRMDGPASVSSQSATVSGAGLTWSLVRRTNARFGTSEVWAAFAPATLTNVTVTATPLVGGFRQAFTVIAFANSAGPGASASNSAATGAPTVSLATTQANSLVYAAGNDWDTATARTVPAGQTMVNQVLDPVGDTFWTQRLTNAVATPSTVTINNTAPTTDQWNFAAVEIKGL